MTDLGRYPTYTNSKASYLGAVPAHWQEMRLRFAVRRLETGGTPDSGKAEFWGCDGAGIPFVAIGDMTRFAVIRETTRTITQAGRQARKLPILPSGSLLYSIYATLGEVAVLAIPAVVNQAILGIVPNEDVAGKDFLRWWLIFMKRHISHLSSNNTQDNLSAKRVRDMPLLLPSLGEQQAIADFLDRETTKIDALVAQKQRLIELLQEKRTALVTRAVTKGLDPDVEMKDSGVEWLGEIPAHWEVAPLRFLLRSLDQGWSPAADDRLAGDDEWGILKLSAISKGRYREHEHKALPAGLEGIKSIEIQPEDVLVTRANTPQLVGDACYVRETNSMMMFSDLIYRLRFSLHVDPEFATFWLIAPPCRQQIQIDARGSSLSMVKIAQAHIKAWLMPVPPLSEQREIVSELTVASERLDDLEHEIQNAITLLTEYRTALISAAVTGKIDVRTTEASP